MKPPFGWPAVLSSGPVTVRPLRRRDAVAWSDLRIRNQDWLGPWEGQPAGARPATWAERHSPQVFAAMLRVLHREARAGRALPFGITVAGRLAGQVTVSNVVRGAFDSGYVGYWVDGALAGRGVAPTALALVADHCLTTAGMHRLEANIRPENAASRRVVEKLGFRAEGRHERYLYIDGAWRDHLSFALTTEDRPEAGVLTRMSSL